ncbi:MAG TPA: hypothetical protein VFX82_05380 [Desulfobacterales bacterium]|nr:hypothetical protein [Desulfobacterales bacterium]
MPKGLKYENDYIVGGPANCRVTPNFALSEYAAANGKVRIHRELVASVQVLRNSLGAAVSIAGIAPASGLGKGLEGRFVWLKANDLAALEAAARKLMKEGHFIRVEPSGGRLYVEMPDPDHLPALLPEKALDLAIAVTAGFETSGDPYLQVTGNFDGAGLSFGPLQVNFKTGTLQELFRRFQARDETRLRTCFGSLWTEWQRVLHLPSRVQQVAWADALSRGARKADFDPRWKAALQAVGSEPVFRSEMLRYAYDTYGRKLIVALSWLRGLVPVRISNVRCLAALYDLCVQQGSLDKAHDAIRRRVLNAGPLDEFQLTRIAVEERGRKADPRWRADCISRRMCIIERDPVKVVDSGQIAERDNPNLYLLRNASVSQIERYLT